MGLKLSHLPLRLVTGAFILNSGITKRGLDRESSEHLQKSAGLVYPPVASLEPEKFGRMLSWAEIGLGATLLAPFVPSRLAGLGLGVFSCSLLTMYHKTPGMTEADGIRPKGAGVALAKDIWMFGIALALILDTKKKK